MKLSKRLTYCIILFLIILGQKIHAQEPLITYTADSKPLSEVLNEISKNSNLKFAFDADIFQKIDVSLNLKNVTIYQFLQELDTRYQIHSKLLENTRVLVYAEPEREKVVVVPIPQKKKVTVSGFVKDAQSGENLLYCGIQYGESKGAMTNNLGYFSFEIAATEEKLARILISHLGYKRLDTLVNIGVPAVIHLEPAEILMQDIVVNEVEKNVLEAAPQPDKIGFNPMKSANIPRIAEDDLANALLLIPGISFLQGSYSGLSIRGSSPTDNLVLFDGIPVLETSHLLGNISVLNSKYVHQAFVSRGGFDAEFGGRVSGLIELTGRSGKNSGTYVDLSANLLNTNILANVPLSDKVSVTAAWRRSFIDQWQNYLYLRLIDDEQHSGGNAISSETAVSPKLSYQDVNANVNFHPNDKLEFNVNLLYGDDSQSRDYQLENASNLYHAETQASNNIGFSFNWNWQIRKNWFQGFTAGYSKLNKNGLEETGEIDENSNLKSLDETFSRTTKTINRGINNVEEYRLHWKTELKTGIFRNQAGIGWTSDAYSYNYYSDRSDSLYSIDSITGSARQYLLNAFVQQHIQLAKPLLVRWGLRTAYDLYRQKAYWQPRAGIEYRPMPGLNLHYSTGIYYQFLSSARRIDSEGHFSPLWYLPESNGIGVVKGIHQMAGLIFEKNGWMVNTEGYLKNTEGKITLLAEVVNNGSQREIKYFPHATYERSKGIDLFLQKKTGPFNHMAGYSFSKAEEKIADIMDESWFPWYNDRTHQFKINEMYTYKNWTFTGSWHFGSGLPVVNLSEEMTVEEIEHTSYFSQLDLAVVRKFETRFFTANAGISLLNILNRTNIVEVDYLRFSSESASISARSDVSALGFTPLFFVNFKIQ